MATTPKYDKVKITDEEMVDVNLMRDTTGFQLDVHEFNIKQAQRQIELGMPAREAAAQLREMETQATRLRFNKKMYDKQVRTKMREVPVQYVPQEE